MAWDTPQEAKKALENIGMVDYVREHEIPPTLAAALEDGNWEVILHQFAAAEFSTENLDFLRAVGEFESSGDLGQAEEIYEHFVSTDAAKQVNLPASIRGDLDAIFGEGGTGHGPPSLFDAAKAEITRMTSNDTFQRFKARTKAAQDSFGAAIDWDAVQTRDRR